MPSVELREHAPEWNKIPAREAVRIRDALGDTVVAVHHIGSTAIPGIRAKPVIDLMPLVTSLAALDAAASSVRMLGYEWLGEFGIPERRFCRRDDTVTGRRFANVHFFASESAQVTRHLAFRDYLRAHPAIAHAYEAEKQRAAALHPDDVHAYTDEKAGWIKAAEQDALAWRETQFNT
jgi:GrpB-like predicted nucleotidyltransferase (UPF0157 family)